MTKKILATFLVLGLFFVATPVGARPELITAVYTVKPSVNGVVVTLPRFVGEVAPGVFSLGTSVDPSTGQVVEGLAIIHYREGFSHKPNHPDKGGKPGGGGSSTSSCFSYLARGAEWKVFGEGYVVDPSNTVGLNEASVRVILAGGINQWEDAADGFLGDETGVDVFGDEDLTKTVNRNTIGELTGSNEVMFASISESNVIAVTYVWGIFSGPPRGRKLVEWNMVFNVNFGWSTAGDVDKMDFENIAVHELGHAFGMGHPDSTCTEETMYAFASFGETQKRTLNAGDIAGIDKLY